MPNRRFNTQVAQPRKALADGGRAKMPMKKKTTRSTRFKTR